MRTTLYVTLCLSAMLISLVGCASVGNRLPGAAVPLAALETSATYDVLGPTTGTSTGAYILGFIPIGMERKYGAVTPEPVAARGFLFPASSLMNPIERAALYNAIEAKPGADALLAPRWSIVKKSYVVYSEQTVTVKGKAIRFNASAE